MRTKYTIRSRDLRLLRARALRAQRDHSEVCGALLEDGAGNLRLVFMENRAGGPQEWLLKASDLDVVRNAARQDGLKLVGTFHSHPVGFATPSEADLLSCSARDIQLIFDVCARHAKLWRVKRTSKRRAPVEIELTTAP